MLLAVVVLTGCGVADAANPEMVASQEPSEASGQQQVRNLFSKIATWHVNLWLHTLVELSAWDRTAKDLVHREDTPWDRSDRRPRPTCGRCPASRRQALQAQCLACE